MDIGGNDQLIQGAPSQADLDVIFRTARAHWEDAVVELDTGVTMPVEQAITSHIDPFLTLDLFIYKNMATKLSWDEHGRTDENDKDMFYVQTRDTCINLTHSDDQLAKDLVTNIQSVRVQTGQCA